MRHSVLGLGAASLAVCALSASADPMSEDTGPVYVGTGSSSVIHRRGKFKPNQRKQRAGKA